MAQESGKTRGLGRVVLATLLLVLDGGLNIIYGVAAIAGGSIDEHPTHYIIGNLDSWGWVSLILGILQLLAAGSLLRGHTFGRYFGIAVGGLVAIEALVDIRVQPYWSLAVFGLSLWIVYGLATYSEGSQGAGDIVLGPDEPMPLEPRPPA